LENLLNQHSNNQPTHSTANRNNVSAVMATATAYQQQEKKYTKQHMTRSNSTGGIGNHAINGEGNGETE